MNAADWAYLDRIREQQRATQPQAPEPQMGFLEYAGKRLANVPNNVAASIGDTVAAGLDFLTGKPAELRQEEARQREMGRGNYLGSAVGAQASAFDLPAPQGVGQKTLNILTSVGEELPGLLAPASAIGKGARLFGAGRAAPVVGGAGAGALSGYRDSAGEAGMQAAEFGLMEAAGALLPPGTRALRRAAVEAAAGVPIAVGGQMLRGNDPLSTESLIQTGTQAAFPFGMQARRIFRERGAPRPEPAPPPQPMQPDASMQVLESVQQADGTYRTRIQTADGVFEQVTDRPFEGAPVRSEAAPAERAPAFDIPPGEPPAGYIPQRRLPTPRPARPEPGYQDPYLSAEPEAAAARPSTAEPVVSAAQPLRPLRPLNPGERGAVDWRLIAPVAGAAAGYAVNGGEGAAIGATVGALPGAAGAIGRRLLRRLGATGEEAASRALRGEQQPTGQRLFGRGVRAAEKWTKANQAPALSVASERSRGAVDNIAQETATALKGAVDQLKGLTPAARSAVNTYLSSDRSAAATAFLRRSVPREVADLLETTTKNKSAMQEMLALAESDPERAKLLRDTLGTWVTEPYRAYVANDRWQRPSRADIEAIVKENQGLPEYAGQHPESIRADVEDWVKEVNNFGGDWSRTATEGKSRMSRSLYIGRKQLRPSVKKLLGYIEDPVEREVLSIGKLVKSARTAKFVTELADAKDDAGRALLMTRPDWEAAIDSAVAKGDTATASFLRTNYEKMPESNKGLGIAAKSKAGQPMMGQRQVLDALQAGPGHEALDWEKGILGTLAKIQRIPKGAFTLYNPATHLHNVFQAPLQGMAAGLNPVTFVAQVRRFQADKKRIQWAKEDGVLDAHLGAGEFRRAADSFETILNPPKLSMLRKVHEAVKRVYGKPDQWARGAAYNNFLDEGLGKLGMPERKAREYAVEMTNRYTQNYSNVAPLVAAARNIPLVNPFVSYTAEMLRIIKNLADDVINDPLKAKYGVSRRLKSGMALVGLFGLGSGIKAIVEQMSLSPEDKARLEALAPSLPAYQRGKTMIGGGTGKDVGLFNANPWLPAEDFVTLAKNILSGDLEAFATNNPIISGRNPVISAGFEMATGRDPFTGKVSSGTERFIDPILENISPPLLPPYGRTAQKLRQAFTRNEEGELGVTDERGRRETPATALLSAAGVSIAKIDEKRLLRAKANDQKRLLAEAAARRNKVLRSDIHPAAKNEARAEYQEERRRILGR